MCRFWLDTMGGGKKYHGGDFRLNFHHSNNASQVMNARGATRWMHHMRETIMSTDFRCVECFLFSEELDSVLIVLRALMYLESDLDWCSVTDGRVKPCIVDFLRTKMVKYAKQHSWEFNEHDFEGLE